MLKEELEIIFFYLKNKRYAVSKMKSFVAPLNTDSLDNMQVIYSLYFYSLFSLVDYIKNVLKQGQILTDFYAIVGGENNYKYVRILNC